MVSQNKSADNLFSMRKCFSYRGNHFEQVFGFFLISREKDCSSKTDRGWVKVKVLGFRTMNKEEGSLNLRTD